MEALIKGDVVVLPFPFSDPLTMPHPKGLVP